jgi:hypothetical protein
LNDTTPTPIDEPTAAELAAAGTIRPLDQIPSPWTVKGNPPIISQPSLDALSPADQQAVLERAGSSDPTALQKALLGFLQDRQSELRIRCGPGEGASETERVALCQVNRTRLLTEEAKKIEAELEDVISHRTEYDEVGKPHAVPVYRAQGSTRTALMARLDQINHEMLQVAGIDGQAELERATRADAMAARELRRQSEENTEAKRRAEEMLREERINERARTYAKHQRHVIG